MYLNKALIVGNLTRDPELRALPGGSKVCQFSVATNRVWKDKNNVKQESADYHNVVVFGNQAEQCATWLKRGQQVLVEGRMQTRSWDNKDGMKQYRTEIVADRVQFGQRSAGHANGGSAKEASGDIVHDADAQGAPNRKIEASAPSKVEYTDRIEYPEDEINPADIPF